MRIHSRFSLPLAALLLIAPVCSAITITRTFITAGNTIGATGVTATAAASNVAGGGNLISIFNTAADYWQAALLDSYTLGLSFGWGDAGGGSTLAFHSLGTEGGSPNRELSGGIVFDSSASFAWFLDASPADNSEYGPLQTASIDLGGGSVNDARFYTGATGSAVGRIDLLSVAVHEIGHSLGLSGANSAYQAETCPDNDVDVTGPRPFVGSAIPVNNTCPGSFNAHLNSGTFANALMIPAIGSGTRRTPSAVDILADAQISQFTSINLDPALVPEPGTWLLLTGGLGIVAFRRRLHV